MRVLIGRLLQVGPRREGAGSFVDDGAGSAVEGSQAALLSGRALDGDLEGSQIAQSAADFLEAMLQGNGVWGEGVRDRTAHRGQGVT
jgi:hypothetical protein